MNHYVISFLFLTFLGKMYEMESLEKLEISQFKPSLTVSMRKNSLDHLLIDQKSGLMYSKSTSLLKFFKNVQNNFIMDFVNTSNEKIIKVDHIKEYTVFLFDSGKTFFLELYKFFEIEREKIVDIYLTHFDGKPMCLFLNSNRDLYESYLQLSQITLGSIIHRNVVKIGDVFLNDKLARFYNRRSSFLILNDKNELIEGKNNLIMDNVDDFFSTIHLTFVLKKDKLYSIGIDG